MNIRKKIFLIFCFTFIGLAVLVCSIPYVIFINKIDDIEEKDTRMELERIMGVFDKRLDVLASTTRDYASWDETAAFMATRNPHFKDHYFIPLTFRIIKVDFVILLDREGNKVYGAFLDKQRQKILPLPRDLEDRIIGEVKGGVMEKEGLSKKGFFFQPSQIFMIATRPVMNTREEGEVQGVMVMGKTFDDEERRDFSDLMKASINLFGLEDPGNPADVTEIKNSLRKGGPYPIRALSDNRLAVYAPVADAAGDIKGVLRAVLNRSIYRETIGIVSYLVFSVMATVIVFAVLMFMLIERVFVHRLVKIADEIRQWETTANLGHRLEDRGDDEISAVAKGINLTLDKLKAAEEDLRREADRYRCVVEDQTEYVCRFLPDGTLTFVNGSYFSFFGHQRRELVGRHFLSFVPEEDKSRIEKMLSSLTPENPTVEYENTVIKPDGSRFCQLWRARAVFDAEGRIVEYQAVGRDNTERKKMEEELLSLNRRLETANQSLSAAYAQIKRDRDKLLKRMSEEDLSFILDRGGTIVGISERVLEFMRLPRAEIVGRPFTDFLVEEADSFPLHLRQAWLGATESLTLTLRSSSSSPETLQGKISRITIGERRLLLITLN